MIELFYDVGEIVVNVREIVLNVSAIVVYVREIEVSAQELLDSFGEPFFSDVELAGIATFNQPILASRYIGRD